MDRPFPSLPPSGPLRRLLPGKGAKTFQRISGNVKQSGDLLSCQLSPCPSAEARITKKLPLMCLLWLVDRVAQEP